MFCLVLPTSTSQTLTFIKGLSHESRSAIRYGSPLQQAHSRHSLSPPPSMHRAVDFPTRREEREQFQDRYVYPQAEYHPHASRGPERASPRGSPSISHSTLPPLSMHPHYQPPLQEYQLIGPTARMQELTLLQGSPRLSHSAPGSGYYAGAERTAAGSGQPSSSRYASHHPEVPSSRPAHASDIPPPVYASRRESPALYDLQGHPFRLAPSSSYSQPVGDLSSGDVPPAAKRARTSSFEGPEAHAEGQLPSPMEGRPAGDSVRGRMSGMGRAGGRGRSTPASTSASRSGARTPLDSAFPPAREPRIAPAISYGPPGGLDVSLGASPGYPGPSRRVEQSIHPQLLHGSQDRGQSREVDAQDTDDDTDASGYRGAEGDSPRPFFVIGSAQGEGLENRPKLARNKIDVACDFCRSELRQCLVRW